MQPKIGEIITVENVKYITELAVNPDKQCNECHLLNKPCMDIDCIAFVRKDDKAVIFKEVKEMEIKIQIPDNCELIKDGDTYIVKEKKQGPPRSWEEFCEKYPIGENEVYFSSDGEIRLNITAIGQTRTTSKWMINKQEAEAFLALIQLRQLRKAWVGDWEQPTAFTETTVITYNINDKKLVAESGHYWTLLPLSFPTKQMAKEFLECFKDLCETAKILL